MVVKDLSRFGRDYLTVGDYLEHIFPFLGVRFISINDNYDSANLRGKTIGMDIAFENLIYDYYCKDLSKKVKSAIGMKQKECHYVSCVPYGYKSSPQDKHQLVVDEETAPIVRRIFMDAIDGYTCTEIARMLNGKGVLTPSQYKNAKMKYQRPTNKGQQWTHSSIHTILCNIKYTGAMVNHTRESRFLRDKSQRRVPKEEWYIKEDCHDAIVSKEEFDQANASIHHRSSFKKVMKNESDRVYFCGHCGRKLEKANGTVFACVSHRYHLDSQCEQVRIRKDQVEAIVLEALKTQICFVKTKKAISETRPKSEVESLLREISSLKQRIETCLRDRLSQYEAYRAGQMTIDEFLTQKETTSEE